MIFMKINQNQLILMLKSVQIKTTAGRFYKDTWVNITSEQEPFTFNAYGSKVTESDSGIWAELSSATGAPVPPELRYYPSRSAT